MSKVDEIFRMLDECVQSLIQDNHAEDGEGRYGSSLYDEGVTDLAEEFRATIEAYESAKQPAERPYAYIRHPENGSGDREVIQYLGEEIADIHYGKTKAAKAMVEAANAFIRSPRQEAKQPAETDKELIEGQHARAEYWMNPPQPPETNKESEG